MTFRVGQKVVCVDASPPRDRRRTDRLVLGAIYTIRGFDPETGSGIWLEGVTGPVFWPHQHEHGWAPERFRPLIDTTKQVDEMRELIRPIMEGKTVELVQ